MGDHLPRPWHGAQEVSDKPEAVDAFAKARVDIARGMGLLPVDAKVTLNDFSQQWLATLNVRQSTRANP
jgi:hypothetical protein